MAKKEANVLPMMMMMMMKVRYSIHKNTPSNHILSQVDLINILKARFNIILTSLVEESSLNN
jgi:hypothetical protein